MLNETCAHEGEVSTGSARRARGSDWQDIDRNLRRIAGRRAALDGEEVRWLREAVREEIWHEVGMVSVYEYLEARLGYGPQAAHDRLRVALALEELPAVSEALENGRLPFTAVRELSRVATEHTENAWLDAANGKNVHQIEALVAGHRRGDLPSDPKRPDLRMCTLRFSVRPETFAKLREVQRILEEESGLRLDDDQLIASLCDAVLSPNDRATHQVMVTVCERCKRAVQSGGGRSFEIGRAALELAECDASHLDPETQRAIQDIPPRTRRFVRHRDGNRCCVPGCRATRFIHIHHIVPRAQGGGHEAENLTLLCFGHHRKLHDGDLTITGPAPHIVVGWTHGEPDTCTHVGSASPKEGGD